MAAIATAKRVPVAALSENLVRPERFELPTCCSGGNRSIQLSYGRARLFTVYMGKGNGFNATLPAD
jgi:hypothetical protein